MALTSYDTAPLGADILNPLNFIQDIFAANDWPFERCDEDELLAEMEGRWSVYRFSFLWRDDTQTLSFACVVDLEAPIKKPAYLYELTSRINERLWLGHFEVLLEDPSFSYRYTLPILPGSTGVVDQIGEIIDIIFMECDRFYPAFLFVASGAKRPVEALVASVADVQGEA